MMNVRKKQIITSLLIVSILVIILDLTELYRISHTESISNNSSIKFLFSGLLICAIIQLILVLITLRIKTNTKNTTWIEEDKNEKLYEINTKKDNAIIDTTEYTFKKIDISDIIIENSKNNISDFSTALLSKLGKIMELGIGIMYIKTNENEFSFTGAYGYLSNIKPQPFKEGEGINGQVVKNKKALRINNIPDNYFKVISGLGTSSPKFLLIMPLIKNGEVFGLLELASFVDIKIDIDSLTETVSTYVSDKVNQLDKSI